MASAATSPASWAYAAGLHDDFNLVAIDQRNAGRSTGDETTAGVLEQDDLRAIIDWLEETKAPEHIGVLGNSLGAAGAITEARTDPRVEALALDSMHTRLVYQFEQRLSHNGHPAYPGVWGSSRELGCELAASTWVTPIPPMPWRTCAGGRCC